MSLFRTAFADQAAHMIRHEGRPAASEGGPDFLGPAAGRRLYECRDGWVCVEASSAAESAGLGALAGVALAPGDAAEGVAGRAVAAVLAKGSRVDALARLAAAGVPAAPCRTFDELFDAPETRAAGAVSALEQPSLGVLRVAGPFLGFSATPIVLARGASLLGVDGAEVLAEIGYDPARIARLVREGVVGGATRD